jgi:hypothetical protein
MEESQLMLKLNIETEIPAAEAQFLVFFDAQLEACFPTAQAVFGNEYLSLTIGTLSRAAYLEFSMNTMIFIRQAKMRGSECRLGCTVCSHAGTWKRGCRRCSAGQQLPLALLSCDVVLYTYVMCRIHHFRLFCSLLPQYAYPATQLSDPEH